MKAITLQVQVRTITVPSPLPAIRRAAVKSWEAICILVNLTIIALGILAAAGFILSLIFPNAAGLAFAWAIYELAQWARGIQ